jgi:glucoamylase
MDGKTNNAPGWPGIPARWTSSAKSGVGTALNRVSRVWFTLSHGILNEIYYPRADLACIRDMGLIVTDGKGFFSEEKRHTRQEVSLPAQGVPAYRLTNTCLHDRYRIEKEVLADPARDSVVQRVTFLPAGQSTEYHLYTLLSPHLGNQGAGNTAWVGDYKGVPMLFASREGHALALACSVPWKERSVGFVGTSDGWQDLMQHKSMTWQYERAENGNVAMIGEIDLATRKEGTVVLALGFGMNAAEAGLRALASLQEGFDTLKLKYVQEWQAWQQTCFPVPSENPSSDVLYSTSMSILRMHEAKRFPGGMIASLSVPWGFAKGDNDLGGYHLVWPRDLVETASAFIAGGALEDGRHVLEYLRSTQEVDGHWHQNMWLDGTPYWEGIQMDETAFPVLLLELAHRKGVLKAKEIVDFWPMAYKAAGFLLRNGPVTQEDRWEEDPGYSPFTLAVEIAALLAASEMAELNNEFRMAAFLREKADEWNECIERWTYVTDTELARKVGVEGYYVRISPPEVSEAASPSEGFVAIKNRPPGTSAEPATHVISPDALALVRFGLRSAQDARIQNTVKAIDAVLKVETPHGPAWHRYNDDGYGEHEDGSPFDGTGVGRLWPLLTGERAHFELAAGRVGVAKELMRTMEAFANEGHLLSEQIWDSMDIPERELFFAKPSGSAMPLVWAHAEYVKLRRSLKEGSVFDTPPQTVKRYIEGKADSPHAAWCFNKKIRSMCAGKILRIETQVKASVRWTSDNWKTFRETPADDTGLGLYVADLSTKGIRPGGKVAFTFYWSDADRWEGENYEVEIRRGDL